MLIRFCSREFLSKKSPTTLIADGEAAVCLPLLIALAPSTGGSEGTYRAKINNGPRDTVDMVGKNLNADEWYMLTVVQNGDAVKVYVNGELVTVNEYCVNANMATYGEPLLYCYLGKSATESDPMFVGMIDEFRLYNRALSASSTSRRMP